MSEPITVYKVAEHGRLAIVGDVAVHFARPVGSRQWRGATVKVTAWDVGPSAYERWEAGEATYLFDFDLRLLWEPSDEQLGHLAAELLGAMNDKTDDC